MSYNTSNTPELQPENISSVSAYISAHKPTTGPYFHPSCLLCLFNIAHDKPHARPLSLVELHQAVTKQRTRLLELDQERKTANDAFQDLVARTLNHHATIKQPLQAELKRIDKKSAKDILELLKAEGRLRRGKIGDSVFRAEVARMDEGKQRREEAKLYIRNHIDALEARFED
ncbi:uncharacterized protein LY89DRAFT_781143 [Mollisia scopiformis]|uniref:Uncharacterized protein n=1 Tax=Mollisia scopiformis TaxID=149040 RepID=A0A194XD13_MOLSC|nr:uncharacterized protein LY89DRAFT_781143 [Mollisia scopiformis]KUJ18041.1 hypothetical protein LY89DRAFT_781143 [Mollisia scopiformis]